MPACSKGVEPPLRSPSLCTRCEEEVLFPRVSWKERKKCGERERERKVERVILAIEKGKERKSICEIE